MADTSSDKLAMLYSADWIFPHWDQFGLNFEFSKKKQIQIAAQDTVRDFMNGVKIYWNISFEPSRIQRSQIKFVNQMKKSGIQSSEIDRLFEILTNSGIEEKREVETTIWLFSQVTELLAMDEEAISFEGLDLAVKNSLQREIALGRSDISELDFEDLALSSETPWDVYLRNLTPNLPSALADFIDIEIKISGEFKRFWCRLTSEIDRAGQEELLTWYVRESKRLAGGDVKFQIPSWMSC
jgi:hypothetical protein